MADDASQLAWTSQQWADLRAAALDSARSARVASTFLPLVGPLSADQTTVPANWMNTTSLGAPQRGEAENRLEVRSGKTLHLVTISCNVYLRGAEVADPELSVAKAMVRRAAEVLGRLEDAIVFHGSPADGDDFLRFPTTHEPVVRPLIYRITGGHDLTGLLHAPDKSAQDMIVDVEPDGKEKSPIVDAIVAAIQKLEARGHFGPFAVVLGHKLFSRATTPTGSLVLPTDRIAEFLDGRRVMRSGTLAPAEGVVVALGGQPIELVLARDIDIAFLQVTVEPRYVLRVFERFVLRIKELDAVCRVAEAVTGPAAGPVADKAPDPVGGEAAGPRWWRRGRRPPGASQPRKAADKAE